MWLSEQMTPYLAAAARTCGGAVLASDTETETAAALGQWLLREIFGSRNAGTKLPEPVEGLIDDPEDGDARAALEDQVQDALSRDPRLHAAVRDRLTRFLRKETDAGNTEAMMELGDLLRGEKDYTGARAVYQQAIEAGDPKGLILLAHMLYGGLGDADGARTAYQQAIDSGNADVAAQALVNRGHLLMRSYRDYGSARTSYEQAIGSGHPDWAPTAMVALARLMEKQGDTTGAQDAYHQAIESGSPDAAARASVFLGNMLRKQGDAAGARAAYQRVIESGNVDWASAAGDELLNLM